MPDDYCQPCGECPWCDRRWRWRDKATKHAADLRVALKLINLLAGCIDAELFAAGADEVRQHPTLRAYKRALDRARRFLAKRATP